MIRAGKPDPDRDRRLDLERAPDDLLSDLAEALRGALAQSLDQGALVIVGAGLRTYAEQRREDCGLEQHAPMVVDLIFESSAPSGSAPESFACR
jgi:hypothetical protein